MSINGIVPLPPIGQAGEAAAVQNPIANTGAAKAGVDFSKFLQEAIDQVNALQLNAETASAGLATGKIQDLHTAIIALEKASLSMSLTVEVRNKVLDAYNEMMRMQI